MALLTKTEGTKLIQAPAEQVKEVVSRKAGLAMFDLSLDGSSMRVVMKSVQRDPVTRKVTHMSVQEIKETDIIKVAVPVIVVGEPAAVTKRAATLMVPMSQVEVQAQVSDLPDSITIDVSGLKQNDKITIADVEVPKGVTFLSSPGTVLASTKQLRGMSDFEDAGEEAPAEAEAASEAPAEAPAEATEEPAADAE